MKLKYIIYIAALAMSSCATQYQQQGLSGGYSETQIDKNMWIVTFKGNGYTNREKATDYNLLRCADLCMHNGYKYFIVVQGNQYTRESSYTTPTTSYTTGSAYLSGRNVYGTATTNTYGGHTYNISKPTTSNTIVCFKTKPSDKAGVYNAEFISNSIRSKYKIQ